MVDPRREFLFQLNNVRELKGLEIGPLSRPLMTKEDVRADGEIFYLDHLSTENLRKKYADEESINIKDIVMVDYVCHDGDIVKAVDERKFDYIVASHIIEHAPNFLGFLSAMYNSLKPGGNCVLIIPDKRFTFDLPRPITTFGAVLENFLSDVSSPSISAVYDHSAMAINADGHNLWNGILNAEDTRLLASEKIAWEAANKVHNESRYYDVHVNIFTPESFFSILKKSINHEIIFFKIDEFLDTQAGQIEFMVRLKKPDNEACEDNKFACLASLPKFELESILSPYMPQVKSLSSALENSSEMNLILKKELEELNKFSRDEIVRLQSELQTALKMLDRRSVKWVLDLIHKFNNLFRK